MAAVPYTILNLLGQALENTPFQTNSVQLVTDDDGRVFLQVHLEVNPKALGAPKTNGQKQIAHQRIREVLNTIGVVAEAADDEELEIDTTEVQHTPGTPIVVSKPQTHTIKRRRDKQDGDVLMEDVVDAKEQPVGITIIDTQAVEEMNLFDE